MFLVMVATAAIAMAMVVMVAMMMAEAPVAWKRVVSFHLFPSSLCPLININVSDVWQKSS